MSKEQYKGIRDVVNDQGFAMHYSAQSSGGPKGRQAEPHNYRNGITGMDRNRNPCNSFFMVKMDRGHVGPTTMSYNMAALLGLIPSLAALVYSMYF